VSDEAAPRAIDHIRVVIVDDHAVIRAGLEQLLAGTPDIEVVGEAEGGEQSVDVVRRLRPDVVLMDLQMPGVDGVAATRMIMAEGLDVDVLVLTSYSDRERILAALDAGAVGYLLKDADPDDVLQGIRAGSSQVQLTARETEVLRLVREGLANKQIARRLHISERTVKAHLTSAFARIGVSDRTQAALWVERNGL